MLFVLVRKADLGQNSPRYEMLMLRIVKQACQKVLWAICLLVCQGLQASVIADVPDLYTQKANCQLS